MSVTDRIVCLVGTHPLNRDWALEMEPGVEFWAANEAGSMPLPGGAHYVFQLHPRDWREAERRFLNGGELPAGIDPNCFGRSAAHVEMLRASTVPVYCQADWADIPNARIYPFDEVGELLGVPPDGRLWATSTFGYMLALALYQHTYGPKIAEIRLAGVELPIGTMRERVWEWPNLAYYLGVAAGWGIKISLPPTGSSLMNAPLYAVESPFVPNDPDHWWSPAGSLGLVEIDDGRYGLVRTQARA